MDNFWMGILTGVLASLFCAGLVAITKKTFNTLKSKKESFTGIWDGVVFDSAGNIQKRDEYDLRFIHYTNHYSIDGFITRIFPERDKNRKWKCWGKLIGNRIVIVCWNGTELALSSATLQHLRRFKYTGAYLRVLDTTKEIVSTKLEIEKRM